MELINLLAEVLGNYICQKDEYLFHCPFCHHKKKKLSINITTTKWRCWRCGAKGGHLIWLLKKLNISPRLQKQFREVLKDIDFTEYASTTSESELFLPQEYKPLWIPTKSYPYLHAITYLKKRGIRTEDILRFKMGYCETGDYSNRIIIPSYDENGKLNYFTARAFYDTGMKYKNPTVSKNIVCFENMINWNEQIILCEGVFDAIAIRRNAIPLLGKTIPKALEYAIMNHKVKDVIVFLDVDARTDGMVLENQLRQHNINLKLVSMDQKDPSDMGFAASWNAISSARTTNFKEFITQRLSTI